MGEPCNQILLYFFPTHKKGSFSPGVKTKNAKCWGYIADADCSSKECLVLTDKAALTALACYCQGKYGKCFNM